MTDTTLRAAQLRMLELLKAFDAVCKKHDLTYWLDHGTLLGAVRHEGFIPWDDDLDVTMPREDYERFLGLASKELPGWIFLQTKESDPTVPVHYAKLRDRTSTYIDRWEEGRKIAYHQGIFIDIFPVNFIDPAGADSYGRLLNFAKLFSNRYLRIDTLAKPLIALLNRRHDPKGSFVVSGGECMHYVIHVEKETIFPLRRATFEKGNFPVPGRAEAYLASIFGPDFMQLPPEEKRETHSRHMRVDEPCRKERDG
jgi:lipopolysaccharide cholinephosphotransferase